MGKINKKTQTVLDIIADHIGGAVVESQNLPELFQDPAAANVFAKVPGAHRKGTTGSGARDLMAIHEYVAQSNMDTNFKGIVAKAYRDQLGKRESESQQVPGRTAEQAMKGLKGKLTTASNLDPAAVRTRRGRALVDAARGSR